jgi:hypothetical protein
MPVHPDTTKPWPVWGLIGLACMSCGCTERSSSEAPVETLYVTAGFAGLEGCWAAAGPARLAPLLSAEPKARWLDAGNLLLPDDMTRGPESLKRRARFTARLIRALEVAAVNLGPAELRGGPGFLASLQREGALPLVSANVAARGAFAPSVARSFVRAVGDLQVAVTGALLAEWAHRASPGNFTAWEHGPAIANEISALRRGPVDTVVVLAHVDPRSAIELAHEVPEADLVVHAGPDRDVRDVQGVLVVPLRKEQGSGPSLVRLRLSTDAGRLEQPHFELRGGGLFASLRWIPWNEIPRDHARVQAALDAVAITESCRETP